MSQFLVNPDLPENMDSWDIQQRDKRHLQQWWMVPYVVTFEGDSAAFLASWPSGTRYDVRRLDGGAWDRTTAHGCFATLEEALSKCSELQNEPA